MRQRKATKKDTESWQLARLKEVYSAFPRGELRLCEAPDFLVQAQNRTFGIELTGLFREGAGLTRPLREIEQLREMIASRAENLFMASGGPPVDVAVNFNDHVHLSKRVTAAIAERLARLVRTNLPESGTHLCIEYDWVNRDIFPEEIAYVRIARFADAQSGHWSPVSAGYVPEAGPAHLQSAISRKAGDATTYRQLCDELWLVVVADGFAISSMFSFTSVAQNHIYVSPFDRTIYFENFSKRAYDLKTRFATH